MRLADTRLPVGRLVSKVCPRNVQMTRLRAEPGPLRLVSSLKHSFSASPLWPCFAKNSVALSPLCPSFCIAMVCVCPISCMCVIRS